MAEQANVQARKKAARKKSGANGPEPGPGSQLPAMPQVNQIMAVVVPVEIFDQMKRAVKRQPYDEVELLLGAMKNLMPQNVTMTTPGAG